MDHNMDQETRPSPTRSSSSRSNKLSLTLDLSDLPPLEKPTQPSNTLIFTNLQDLDVFRAENLQKIRDLIEQIAPIHAWSPLKSFRRIVVSFFNEDSAIAVRQVWDGEAIMGDVCRVYFGQPTPISATTNRLELPDAGKLFFISPPPSPPHGWEMKLEDAPNTQVHAEDLADALAKLRHHNNPIPVDAGPSPISPTGSKGGRSRSSTLIFQPQPELGNSPDLPCVTVDDMTDEPMEMSPLPISPAPRTLPAQTARPPVELMHSV